MPGYKKIKRIGSGGQANVWKGVNVDTGDIVALKYLQLQGDKRADAGTIAEERARFIREVRIQKGLDHPNIVPVLDYADKGYHQWYAMPLAEETLSEALKADSRSESWSLEIIHQVINAMEYAHGRGVIHRDIKPNNILRIGDDWLVSDFGFCRDLKSDSLLITKANTFLGTPYYAAPEQYDDAHLVGPTADVYAIGRTLLHCLTGKQAGPSLKFDGVAAPFEYIIRKCAAEEPDDRYQSVAELRTDLIAASVSTA
ncbi:serine/threonine-protein kinase [Nonomuraea sp. NPDC001699]